MWRQTNDKNNKDFLPKPLFDYMKIMVHNKGGQDSRTTMEF